MSTTKINANWVMNKYGSLPHVRKLISAVGDGNWVPKGGFAETPMESENTLEGLKQVGTTNPADYVTGNTIPTEDRPPVNKQVVDALMTDLALSVGRLTKCILDSLQRTGELPRLKVTAKRAPVTTTGIRGPDSTSASSASAADSAERRRVVDAAKASDRAYLEARQELADATGAVLPENERWYMDRETGLYRPMRPERY